MKLLLAGCATFLSATLISAQAGQTARPQANPQAPAAGAKSTAAVDATAQRALLDQYCVTCHNAKLKTANLLLDQLDLTHLGDHAEIGELVVRKLRAGLIPPTGIPRPDRAPMDSLIGWMEAELHRTPETPLPAT